MGEESFRFEKLQVYQKARVLVRRVYLVTKTWPKEYFYDLTSQFRRAALSVLLNIAEGSGRSRKDFARFLNIAIGSCKECVALIDLACDLEIPGEGEYKELRSEFTEVVMMLEGLKKSLR